MHWQLFFPGESANSKALLEKHGMEDFVSEHESMVERSGPEGGGLLIGWKSSIGYDAATQEWEKVDGAPYWIGVSKSDPCRPEELQRTQLFAGYLIELQDGQRWQVPVACKLPETLKLVDKQWTRVRKPRFDEFWNRSEIWYRRLLLCDLDFDQMQKESGLSVEQLDQEWTDFCIFALRQNYRLTADVVSRLGLLDVNSRFMVTASTIEGMQIQEVLDLYAQRLSAETAGLEKKDAPQPPDS